MAGNGSARRRWTLPGGDDAAIVLDGDDQALFEEHDLESFVSRGPHRRRDRRQAAADYYAGSGKDAYVKALDAEKGIYNPTGIMPSNGPPTNLKILQVFNPEVKGKTTDLAKTYTDEFVKSAKWSPDPTGRSPPRGLPVDGGRSERARRRSEKKPG